MTVDILVISGIVICMEKEYFYVLMVLLYEGSWELGTQHGHGVFTRRNGNIYGGYWMDGNPSQKKVPF